MSSVKSTDYPAFHIHRTYYLYALIILEDNMLLEELESQIMYTRFSYIMLSGGGLPPFENPLPIMYTMLKRATKGVHGSKGLLYKLPKHSHVLFS